MAARSSTVAGPAVVSVSCRRASKFISRATRKPSRFLSQRFPASARLRETGEFLTVRAEGRMVQGRFLRMTALRRSPEEPARLGVVTSRRVGGAVQRNRVRRRLREMFRVRRGDFAPGLWLVIVAKNGAAETPFATLREEWLRLAGRLSILRDL